MVPYNIHKGPLEIPVGWGAGGGGGVTNTKDFERKCKAKLELCFSEISEAMDSFCFLTLTV